MQNKICFSFIIYFKKNKNKKAGKKENLISKKNVPGNGTNSETRVRDVSLENKNKCFFVLFFTMLVVFSP